LHPILQKAYNTEFKLLQVYGANRATAECATAEKYGYSNFAAIERVVLRVTLADNVPDGHIYCYGVSYNYLNIADGMAQQSYYIIT
jgi:hypothetical protein